jgi:hypothetical protein
MTEAHPYDGSQLSDAVASLAGALSETKRNPKSHAAADTMMDRTTLIPWTSRLVWVLLSTAVLTATGCQRAVSSSPATRSTAASTESRAESADVVSPSAKPEGERGPSPPAAEAPRPAVEIVFEDIQLPIQADMVFRPFMITDRVRELDGQRIRIHGYMLPDSKTKGIKQFVLLKNTECKFGPGGQADHLVNVLMVDGVTATYRDVAVTVEGVLAVNPFQGPDGNTWSIYDLACERVEVYKPRR